METYEQLVRMVSEVAPDIEKAVGGNKAAGTRVRKSMQDIRKLAQEIRVKILALRSEPKAE